MYIDRKNKKLGIIRSLSYKQWNVDVDRGNSDFKNYVFWLYYPIIFIAIWVSGNA